MVHGWQNDGYQKDLFDEDGETHVCPAGCGEQEGRLHFVRCKAVALKVGYGKRTEKFQTVHKSLKTAGVIYHSLLSMLKHLRDGGEPPSFVSYIASPMENLAF